MIISGYKFNVLKYGDIIPNCEAVYVLIVNKNGKRKIQYVGRASNLNRRIKAHKKIKEIKESLENDCFIEIGYLCHKLTYLLERIIIGKKSPRLNIKKPMLFIPNQYKDILELGNKELLEEFKNEAKRVNCLQR